MPSAEKQKSDPAASNSNGNAAEAKVKQIKQQKSPSSELVTGVEKSYALDTAALLGGNEYLVSQMLDKLGQAVYSPLEIKSIRWGLDELCPVGDVGLEAQQGFNQTHLTQLFANRERLPKTVAMSLLYCGRYDDTTVIQSSAIPHLRAMVINMDHYPMVERPIGSINGNPCRRLAILYFKSAKDEDLLRVGAIADGLDADPSASSPSTRPPAALLAGRKISESLAVEKQMLAIVNVFAILPVP